MSDFHERFGKAHVDFAAHAAFFNILSPDLLFDFRTALTYPGGRTGLFAWESVPDLLCSSLCRSTGYSTCEMTPAVRVWLLQYLRGHPDFGEKRIAALVEFLLRYLRRNEPGANVYLQSIHRTQKWSALIHDDPDRVREEMLQELPVSESDIPNRSVYSRSRNLLLYFVSQVAGKEPFQLVLHYCSMMRHWIGGDLETALRTKRFHGLPDRIVVDGRELFVPAGLTRARQDRAAKRTLRREKLTVGVVIPCSNNARALEMVVRSLKKQSRPPDQVVLVDDNSNRNQQAAIASISNREHLLYRRLPQITGRLEGHGRRSLARNVGTRILDTDIILYLDGDMMLGPRYIEEIVHYHTTLEKVYIRARRFEISPAEQERGIEHCLRIVASPDIPADDERDVDYAPDASRPRELMQDDAYLDRWEWMASNNLSVMKAHVVEIGFWDEAFIGWGEEDMEFSYRLYRHGLRPVMIRNNSAVSFHLEHAAPKEMKELMLKRNAEYFLSKFPEVLENRRAAYEQYGLNINELIAGQKEADTRSQ